MHLPCLFPCWLPGMFRNKQDKYRHVSHKRSHKIHAFTCSTYIVSFFSFRPKWMRTHYGDCTFLCVQFSLTIMDHYSKCREGISCGSFATRQLNEDKIVKSRAVSKPRDWVLTWLNRSDIRHVPRKRDASQIGEGFENSRSFEVWR